MQAKYLIVIALISMAMLLGFNMVNSNHHEQNRVAMVDSGTKEDPAQDSNNVMNEVDINVNESTMITDKPLGEQPKAILDKASVQIDDAQQAEEERLAQMNKAQ
ncbi:hypothetical protein ES754_06610 [Psychrobacter frigidicola]|uniref:Uncharacterized protein n=1 Tax=Psychrobacter frigidicola TaxID=45611 RepID=A0A5C7A013_9GAMM|nr:hypothetical protein [Psychrobacter frigidicola]TXD96714.1 hypothetical protein ES754_06610 [Psychrobacter frigidicola]